MASLSDTWRGATQTPATSRSLVVLQLAVAFFVALKIVYGIVVPPNGDEAYYWLWGGHLQLSYYDHAPMVGWTSAVARQILGWTPAAVHLPAFVTFLVLVYALRRTSRWLAPGDPDRYFWLSLAILCASPLFNALTTLNYPDHLMICFAALALLCIGRFLNGVIEGSERLPDLYTGAVFLGFAGLSKYNAVFIPAGLIMVIIVAPRLRRLFRSPHLYAAGILAFLITLPVFIWNAENRFATVKLHAVDRLEEAAAFTPMLLLRALVLSALMLSPFIVWGFSKYLFGRPAEPSQTGLILLGRGTALVSTLLLLPLAAWGAMGSQVSPHWLVLSFLPFMLVAPFYVRSRLLLGLHLGWGMIVNTLLVVYYLLAPVPTTMLGIGDAEASRTFGQDQLAAEVSAAVTQHGAELVVSRNYTAAAKLAFGLGSDAMISDRGGRVDRLTGRNLVDGYTGKTMILVDPSRSLSERFERVEPIGGIVPHRFDLPLVVYSLAVGSGFMGDAVATDKRSALR